MNNSKHYHHLDGLRFIAVFLVLVDHWLAENNKLPLGPLGVTIFFVLSGFLITGILLKSKLNDQIEQRSNGFSLKQFYIRRSIRIFPIYFLSIFVLYLFNSPSVVGKMWWHLLYATNIFIAIKGTWMGVTDHFWSLAVEEQFYLFFPILVFSVPFNHLNKLFWGMIFVALFSRILLFVNHYEWTIQYVSTITSLDAFGFGALLALSNNAKTIQNFKSYPFDNLFSNLKTKLLAAFAFLVLFIFVAALLAEKRNFANDVLERSVFSIFSLFLIAQAVKGFSSFFKSFLENKLIVYLGKISYGIYVYHNFVYNYYHTPRSNYILKGLAKIEKIIPFLKDNLIFELAYYFVWTVLIASISWFLIEKPINKFKDRFSY